MSNTQNETIKENIYNDVLNMADDHIWNVIFAIQDEFGTHNMPDEISREGFINQLTELRFEEISEEIS